MRFYQLVPLALAVMLAGCGDVGKVKDSKLKGWPQFTVGQMLDKRQACSNIKWESFTDTRDRKIVQYTCENKLVHAYLSGVHEKDVEDEEGYKKLILENAAKELEHAKSSLEASSTRLDEQKQLVAGLNSGEKASKVQALRNDLALLRQVSVASCGQINPQQYTHADVQNIVASMAIACQSSARMAETCPDSLRADRFRYLTCLQRAGAMGEGGTSASILNDAVARVQRMLESAETSGNSTLRYEQETLATFEGAVQRAIQTLETAKEKAAQAPNDPEIAKYDARIERLNRKVKSFQRVREVSQWTVQDGEAVYLGSKVELVFPDRTIEDTARPEFIFEHAANDASSVNDLHGLYLMQIKTMWHSYAPPQL